MLARIKMIFNQSINGILNHLRWQIISFDLCYGLRLLIWYINPGYVSNSIIPRSLHPQCMAKYLNRGKHCTCILLQCIDKTNRYQFPPAISLIATSVPTIFTVRKCWWGSNITFELDYHVNNRQTKSLGNQNLHTYVTFKHFYEVEPYRYCLWIENRSYLAQYNCRILPSGIKTGRWENISLEDGICKMCDGL